MKISKAQSKKITSFFIIALLCIYLAIVIFAKLTPFEAILLLLSIPMILFLTINLMLPFLKKELHRIQAKETSEAYYAAKRKQFKAKGLKDFSKAEWNLAGIEIWAINDALAQKKYYSQSGKDAISIKNNKGVAYYANNDLKK